MNLNSWLQTTPARILLGPTPQRARHVLLVLATTQLYLVNLGIIWHSDHLGVLPAGIAWHLTWTGLLTLAVVFFLVRSGWSRRYADPVLTLPHALIAIALSFSAYVQVGEHRASVLILVAETIVMCMFRLRPTQMLVLGLTSVLMLLLSVIGLTWADPIRYPSSTGLMHFVIGGSTLLILSLVAKWVTDIRTRIGQQAKELSQALSTLQHMATQDTLTGLMNRRVMTDLAEAELKLVDRNGHPLTVALIDLDHFKQINDHHGHPAGDAVLSGFAAHALSQLRQVDKVARWGGEEFLVMMPQVQVSEALAGIERLRQSTESLRFAGYPRVRATFSAGMAQARPGETLEQLVDRADQALYEAKQAGRNRCCLAATADERPAPNTSPVHAHDLSAETGGAA
ncbi:MAG: diguanylate cyclase [Burkholderiales bacterium]|nr:diguanylate cyclase [Burkholderiales bacterium]MBH2016440.1 diguanylate cyclase [Burkholderiales bacterium]